MKDIMVSIIVPIYNGEKYIHRCIKSILKQTHINLEVILVDDGSTDNSKAICDQYSKYDSRVKIICKKNKGVSAARNAGIKIAQGRYIQFIDVDDYIEEKMTEEMIASIKKSDLVIVGYNNIYDDNTITSTPISDISGLYTKIKFLSEFGVFFERLLINTIWNKLYVKKIIDENNIKFDEDISLGEDLLFNIRYIEKCSNITVLDVCLYNYYHVNINSLTSKYKSNHFETEKFLYFNLRTFLKLNKCFYNKNKKSVEIMYTNSVISSFQNLYNNQSNLNTENRKEIISNICNDIQVRDNLNYFKYGNMQSKLIGIFVKYRMKMMINLYYILKEYLRRHMTLVFKYIRNF